jgi:poly(A) polymerase
MIEGAWLRAGPAQRVAGLLASAGHQVYFVGGCVRNDLLGRAQSDIDLASDARPEAVLALAEAAGIRAVPTGIEHGTVTLVVEGQPFEVTTFRRDVAPDGRRSVVEFSDDLAEDAARRDFTMNALYARPDGTVVDSLGGMDDLLAGRVRFVGDPDARIGEDYLRILRFFRFHAWYGNADAGLDAEGLAACAGGQEGLAILSRERVGAEMAKLLGADDPAPSVAAMAAWGVGGRFLPGGVARARAPRVLLERLAGCFPAWRRRLAALGFHAEWIEALRLSRADARALRETASGLETDEPLAVTAWRFGVEAARDIGLIRAASAGAGLPEGFEAEIARGAAACFPVSAADLDLEGPALGAALKRFEARWLASDLSLGRATLLAEASPKEA